MLTLGSTCLLASVSLLNYKGTVLSYQNQSTTLPKTSVGDRNPNPNSKGSERFEGSESDQIVRIRIRIRKDPKANFIY